MPRKPSQSAAAPQETEPLGERLLDRLTGDSDRIQLLRYDRSAGAYNHAGSYEPGGVLAVGLSEFCRLRGGGGKYRARIKHSDGTYGPSTTLAVEGVPRTWGEPGDSASSSSSSSAPTAPGLVGTLEKFLNPFAAALGAALAGVIAKKLLEGKQTDPLLLELLKRGGGGIDPLELQNAIAAAEARGETRGRELGRLTAETEAPARGEPAHGGGAFGAIERGLPQVVDLVNRHLDIEERKTLPRSPAPAPAAAAASTDPLEALLLSVPLIARKFLLSAAEGDEPPEVYAEMVLGKLDDVTAARMPALLARSDFTDVLLRVWPAFAEYREWSESFVVALREAVAPEEDDAPPAADEAAAPVEVSK